MKRIFLIVHGFLLNPKSYKEVERVIKDIYKDAIILMPELNLNLFNINDPTVIVCKLLKLMDDTWETVSKTTRDDNIQITIIGHSMGSLIARRLYIDACDETGNRDCLQRPYSKTWIKNVTRIVIIGGPNRGWSLDSHHTQWLAIKMRTLIVIGNLISSILGIVPLVFKMRRGSSFVTKLRLDWIKLNKNKPIKKLKKIPIIQLLGTDDNIISPEDIIDNLTGQDFIYVEVPKSDHLTILKVYGN